jgi:dihydroorotase/N-acyl-D-amino-acid deacylase
MANRLVLRNGSILDGSGTPAISADLLIEDGKIRDLGQFPNLADAIEMDCSGLVVAPGFIDVHSHSDLQVLEGRQEKLLQGVTTEIVGNCGFSAFPAAADRSSLNEFAGGIFCADSGWGWRNATEYLGAAKNSSTATVHSLVGHGSLRIAEVGLRQGPLEESHLAAMEEMLAACLVEGAVGFSTGLMYAPGSSAPVSELERLCRVVARHDKVYSTHMRSYFGDIVTSIAEQLELARRSGCRLQISHLLIAGRKNWHLQMPVIEMIEAAHASGIDLAFDCYPYVAGSTVLTQTLPQWCLEGGVDALLLRLTHSATRDRIAAETTDNLVWDWKDIFISAVASKANAQWIGMNLASIADAKEQKPIDVLLDLLIEERAQVNMISFNQSEENLRQTLRHPLAIIISDGFYVKGRPHPRLHGTFPTFLGKFVRDQKLMPLPDAIRKITSAPAERFGLKGRGLIAKGYNADITVFDADTIDSEASYDSPELAPKGLHLILREGKPIFRAAGSNGHSVAGPASSHSV